MLKHQEQDIITELDWWASKNEKIDDLLANLAEVEKFSTDFLAKVVNQEKEKEQAWNSLAEIYHKSETYCEQYQQLNEELSQEKEILTNQLATIQSQELLCQQKIKQLEQKITNQEINKPIEINKLKRDKEDLQEKIKELQTEVQNLKVEKDKTDTNLQNTQQGLAESEKWRDYLWKGLIGVLVLVLVGAGYYTYVRIFNNNE